MKPIILRQHEVIHLRDTGSVIAWRVVKPQPKNMVIEGVAHLTYGMDPAEDGDVWYDADCINPGVRMECPYGRTGEERFVREAWRRWDEEQRILYKADYQFIEMKMRWKSPAAMPEQASRFTVTLDVGIENIHPGSGHEYAWKITCTLSK